MTQTTVTEILTQPHPARGGTEALEATEKYLQKIYSTLNESASLQNLAAMQLAGIHSQTIRKLETKLREKIKPGTETLKDSVKIARTAFSIHREHLQELAHQATQIEQNVHEQTAQLKAHGENLNQTARNHMSSYTPKWPHPAPAPHIIAPHTPGTAAHQELQDAANRWNHTLQELQNLAKKWRTLQRQRRFAETTLRHTLNKTPLMRITLQKQNMGLHLTGLTNLTGHTNQKIFDIKNSPEFSGLLTNSLPPQKARDAWQNLVRENTHTKNNPDEQLARRLAAKHALKLSTVTGLPLAVRKIFATEALKQAKENPARAMRKMGFKSGTLNTAEFQARIQAIDRALKQGENKRTLISLGHHEGELCAAVTEGDIANATEVAVLIPGMLSTAKDMPALSETMGFVLKDAKEAGAKNPATVTLIGYNSPNLIEEPLLLRAKDAAIPLAAEFAGLRENLENARIVIVAHSYGSTATAEALKINTQPVDAFVTLGSAGLSRNTTAKQLRTKEIFTAQSRDDTTATIGQVLTPENLLLGLTPALQSALLSSAHGKTPKTGGTKHGKTFSRVNPQNLAGAKTLPIGEGAGRQEPHGHGITAEKREEKTRPGYLSRNSRVTLEVGKVLAGTHQAGRYASQTSLHSAH